MSNRGRVRLIVADVDLHCEIVSAPEFLLPWKLLALSDLDHVDCLCLRESRLLWKLLAVYVDHQLGFVSLPEPRLLSRLFGVHADRQLGLVFALESRLLLKLPFFWRLTYCVQVMFSVLVASCSIPNREWTNKKLCVKDLIRKNTCLIVLWAIGMKSRLFESLTVIREGLSKKM